MKSLLIPIAIVLIGIGSLMGDIVSFSAIHKDRARLHTEQAQITTLKADTVSLRHELDLLRVEVRGAVDDCQFRLEAADQMYSLALEKVNDAARINLLTEDKITGKNKKDGG